MSWKYVVMSCAALVGCAGGGARPPEGYEREVEGGALHAAPIRGVTRARAVMADVLRTATPLADAVAGIDAAELEPTVTTTESGGAPLTTVFARQAIDGVPIRGAYLYLATRAGSDGDAELVGSSYHLYQGASVDTAPTVAEADAVAAARAALRAPVDAAVHEAVLAIRPLDGALTLVWEVKLTDWPTLAVVRAGGARAGRVDVVDDRVYETTGAVDGWIAVGGAPGGRGVPTRVPLPELAVEAGGAKTLTGGDGRYTLAAPEGSIVLASNRGAAARVAEPNGTALAAAAPAAATVDLTLGGAGEKALAHVTAFHATTGARHFLLGNGLTAEQLGAPVEVRVNLPSTCNAYFDPGQRSLNFFSAGGGCRNSAETTIIAHEYGHFVDHAFGGITEGGLSEGWGDLLACLWTGQPVVGGDLFADGSIIRTCDNDYVFPSTGTDEVHALGQAWAGFGWHLRQALRADLGDAAGDEVARALLLPSLVTNAPNIPAAVREVLLRDDDDSDLGNHTPHWAAITGAAKRHGLGFVFDQDLAAPSAVTDLTVTAVSSTSAVLRWTAPGDDGTIGTAARYELRWAPTPITEATFASATALPAPPPTEAGTTQTTQVSLPPGGKLFLAVKAIDELGNTGPVSNVVAVELAPPLEVFRDGAEGGLGAWTATGMWHPSPRYAGTGNASFWYGREDSGTYDNGGRTYGSLTSPVIDLTGVELPHLSWLERVDVEQESSYDRTTVVAFDVAAPTVMVTANKLTGWTNGFVPRLLDLGPLAGRKIQLRFTFDTVDSTANQTTGWAVDDVIVLGDTPPMPPPTGGVLMVNEVLADPPAGFDANHDGAWSARGDEAVELVNVGDGPLDLSGVTVSDKVAVRATLPAGTTLAPGQALVLFGGSAPTLPGVVTIATGGLWLNNDGDELYVRRADGAVLASLTWGGEGGRDQSLTREVDGDPASPMVLHGTVAATPASPGVRADGTPFPGGGAPPVPRLAINEVLADPPVGYDADGDGTSSPSGDEFVELTNAGGAPLDLAGCSIGDTTRVRGVFAAGTVIPPGGVLVVFTGPGRPAGVPAVSFGPLQLDNGGDIVTVRSPTGEVLDQLVYGAGAGNDQSLVRSIEGDPAAPFVLHQVTWGTVASPGRHGDGSAW